VRVMSPMEFRPVTAEDLDGTGRGPRELAQVSAPAAASDPGSWDFALNPDRPWAPAPYLIGLEGVRVIARLRELRARPWSVRSGDRTRTELFAMGAFSAMCWSLGDTPNRPMDDVPAPVCDAEVAGQLRHSRQVWEAGGDGWAVAGGVWVWLSWLTGELEAVSFPDEWDRSSLPAHR
jgi:hypothetical protein